MCPQLCNEHWIWNTVVFSSQPTIVLTVHTSEKSAICSNNTYSRSHCALYKHCICVRMNRLTSVRMNRLTVYEPKRSVYKAEHICVAIVVLVCEMCVGIFNAEDRVNWNAFVRFAPLEWFEMRYFTERCLRRALNLFQSLIFLLYWHRQILIIRLFSVETGKKSKIKIKMGKMGKSKFQWKIYFINWNQTNGCKSHFLFK